MRFNHIFATHRNEMSRWNERKGPNDTHSDIERMKWQIIEIYREQCCEHNFKWVVNELRCCAASMTPFNLVSNDCDSLDVNYARPPKTHAHTHPLWETERMRQIEKSVRDVCRMSCDIDEHLIRNEKRVDAIDWHHIHTYNKMKWIDWCLRSQLRRISRIQNHIKNKCL